MLKIEDIARDIRKAYDKVHTGDWVKLIDVAELAGDLTIEQWRAGMEYLIVNDPDMELMPEINQKTLTRMQRVYEVRCGGVWNHLIQRY